MRDVSAVPGLGTAKTTLIPRESWLRVGSDCSGKPTGAGGMLPLFDENGRIAPLNLHLVTTPSARHSTKQPQKVSPGLIIGTLEHLFPKDMRFVSVGELTSRSEAIVEGLRQNEATANLLRGTHLPICLPRLEVRDYGNVFEGLFLKVLERAYGNAFPDRRFLNHLRGSLNGQLSVLPESRHQHLVAKMADGPVVGVYFPSVFQGYSAQASRDLMRVLPGNMLLAGGLDVATALIAHRGVLASDAPSPDLSLAALNWKSAPEQLLSFKAWSNALTLSAEGKVGYSLSEFSGGLLVIEPVR